MGELMKIRDWPIKCDHVENKWIKRCIKQGAYYERLKAEYGKDIALCKTCGVIWTPPVPERIKFPEGFQTSQRVYPGRALSPDKEIGDLFGYFNP